MKFVLSLISFCLGITFQGKSQNLHARLSIDWKPTEIWFDIPPVKPKTVRHTPYLTIEYCNNSDAAIYFLKPTSDVDGGYPDFFHLLLINSRLDIPERVQRHGFHYDKDYQVRLGDLSPVKTHYWSISGTDPDEVLEWGIKWDLSEISDVFRMQALLNTNQTGKQLNCFRYKGKRKISFIDAQSAIWRAETKPEPFFWRQQDFTPERISTANTEQFIFLKPQETYTQEFNLMGFYLTGGNFSIGFDSLRFTKILPGIYFDTLSQATPDTALTLPNEVNGFRIYEGNILSNSVQLEIKNPAQGCTKNTALDVAYAVLQKERFRKGINLERRIDETPAYYSISYTEKREPDPLRKGGTRIFIQVSKNTCKVVSARMDQ